MAKRTFSLYFFFPFFYQGVASRGLGETPAPSKEWCRFVVIVYGVWLRYKVLGVLSPTPIYTT